MQQLLAGRRQAFPGSDGSFMGFNAGNNVGEVAGQTVMRCHTFFIPRRKGGVDEPGGDVRGVFPERQKQLVVGRTTEAIACLTNGEPQVRFCSGNRLSGLFHGDRLRQIAGLVNIRAKVHSCVICDEL